MNNKYNIGEKVKKIHGDSMYRICDVGEIHGYGYLYDIKDNSGYIVKHICEHDLTPYIEEDKKTKEEKCTDIMCDYRDSETKLCKFYLHKCKFDIEENIISEEVKVKSDIKLFDVELEEQATKFKCINCSVVSEEYEIHDDICPSCGKNIFIEEDTKEIEAKMEKHIADVESDKKSMGEYITENKEKMEDINIEINALEYNLLLEKHAETKELLEIAKVALKLTTELISTND